MLRAHLNYTAIAALVVFVFFYSPALTWAVTVSPALNEISLEPGDKVEREFEILNDEDTTLTLILSGADVRFSQTGVPQFLKTGQIPPDSLLWWLNFDNEPLKLNPKEVMRIKYRLSVPQNATPGGHYAAILVSKATTEDVKDKTALSLRPEVASLLYVNVAGDVKKEFLLKGFRTNKTIYEALPIDFFLGIENTGNTHLAPHGIVRIFNFRNKEVAKILVNNDSSYLYPKQSRDFEYKLEKFSDASVMDLFAGKFRAVLEMRDGADNKIQTMETTFYILPLKALFASVGVLLVLLIGFIVYHKSLVKKTKKE